MAGARGRDPRIGFSVNVSLGGMSVAFMSMFSGKSVEDVLTGSNIASATEYVGISGVDEQVFVVEPLCLSGSSKKALDYGEWGEPIKSGNEWVK